MLPTSSINVYLTKQKSLSHIECMWDLGKWRIQMTIDEQVRNMVIFSGFSFNLKMVGAVSLQDLKGFLNRLSPAFYLLWARRRRKNGYLRKVTGDWYLSIKDTKVYLSKGPDQDGEVELNSTGIRQWNDVKHAIYQSIKVETDAR